MIYVLISICLSGRSIHLLTSEFEMEFNDVNDEFFSNLDNIVVLIFQQSEIPKSA